MVPAFTLASLLDKPGYDEENLARAKLLLAVVGLVALFYEASREKEGTSVTLRWKKLAGAALAVVGVISYFQFFQIGYRDFYHRWDFFYRYLGAKYVREVGHDRLLDCVVVAESEMPGGLEEVRTRKLRDLRVDALVDTGDLLARPERCLRGFRAHDGTLRAARWDAFKGDVAFFRRVMWGNYWRDAQKDHGYPDTPVWCLAGGMLAELQPASAVYCKILASLDVCLWAAMFGCVAWAFGWRVMCLVIFFWGTQDFAPFYWQGGAFLQHLWLFSLLLSLCLVRRRLFSWGGAFFVLAALLKPFLLPLAAGWFVVALAHLVRKRAVHPDHRHLAVGALAAALALVPLSVAANGPGSWVSYGEQIARSSGLFLTNDIGWRQVVVHHAGNRMQIAKDPRLSDPFRIWKDTRRERLQERWLLYRGAQALWAGLFVLVCWRLKNLWVVLALGGLLPLVFFSMNCFHLIYLLPMAALSRGRRPVELALVTVALFTQLCHLNYGWFDDRFAAMSVVLLALSSFVLLLFLRRPRWRLPWKPPPDRGPFRTME